MPAERHAVTTDWGARAARHALRIPFRYRLEGETEWRPGETVNISRSGLLFSTNELLEVDAKMEIIFQTSGVALLHCSTHHASIVRRTLSNWPETLLMFGAQFSL